MPLLTGLHIIKPIKDVVFQDLKRIIVFCIMHSALWLILMMVLLSGEKRSITKRFYTEFLGKGAK